MTTSGSLEIRLRKGINEGCRQRFLRLHRCKYSPLLLGYFSGLEYWRFGVTAAAPVAGGVFDCGNSCRIFKNSCRNGAYHIMVMGNQAIDLFLWQCRFALC
jgi:hypothetical protein